MSNPASRLAVAHVARSIGMSVQNLRKTYINKGRLSVCSDAQNKPYIDLAECLRVFPDRFKLPGQEGVVVANSVASGLHELLQKNEALTIEVQSLRVRLDKESEQRCNAEAREEWLRNHVDKLAAENRQLIVAPLWAAENTKKSGWLSRLFGR